MRSRFRSSRSFSFGMIVILLSGALEAFASARENTSEDLRAQWYRLI